MTLEAQDQHLEIWINSTINTATQALLYGRVTDLGWVSPSPPPLSL